MEGVDTNGFFSKNLVKLYDFWKKLAGLLLRNARSMAANSETTKSDQYL
jgi:threonine aldolase